MYRLMLRGLQIPKNRVRLCRFVRWLFILSFFHQISTKATTKKNRDIKKFILIFCGLVLKVAGFYGYKSNQIYRNKNTRQTKNIRLYNWYLALAFRPKIMGVKYNYSITRIGIRVTHSPNHSFSLSSILAFLHCSIPASLPPVIPEIYPQFFQTQIIACYPMFYSNIDSLNLTCFSISGLHFS